ncbi:MAG: bifunctional diguanylate cyclase/phosphodiesterase [Sphingomicrobium sp.]
MASTIATRANRSSASSVRTTARATHDTKLALVGGRPAAVSAMLIQPSTQGYVGPRREWPVLVSIRYLDSGFVRDLESTHLIGNPRFSLTGRLAPDERALQLRSEDRQKLGYLIWTPELPGSRIMAVLLPVNLVAVLLLSLVMGSLIIHLRQALRERGALEERANHLAYHDALTGLPNRNLLHQRLDEALAQVPAPDLALLLIDLDRFKQVNDTLGHLAGDQLICRFAERLVRVVRRDDLVARLGGDEFAVILSGDVAPSAVLNICQTILGQFAQPFELMGSSVHASASIGAACVAEDAASGTELLRRADVALYRSKAEGRRCARLYEPQMDEESRHRARVEAELRVAVADNQFSLWSQPQVTPGGIVRGHEVLLRWEHPRLGMISPDQIIPVAEETGLIVPIGDWVFDQALELAANGPDDGFIALNLSPVQLRSEGFADRAITRCRDAGVNPARIELEITEQSLLDDSAAIRASLERLRGAGFRIALDDFGTGYSSLNYLRRFTVDKLKIDRGFVAGIGNSAEARAIVAAIVSLGQAFGLTVTAEGVEHERQRELLILAGCDLLQGHLIARAAPLQLSEEKSRSVASLTR